MMKYLLFVLAVVTHVPVAGGSAEPLQIQEVDSGVFMHTSYKMIDGYGLVDSNGLVVVHDDYAVIVDTPWSEADTATLMAWIEGQGFVLKASVFTHFHEDRTAGIHVLNSKSIPTYASELTNSLLAREGKPMATNTFSLPNFSLLNGTLEVFFPGEAHSKDNLIVWLPERRILFGGCLVRSMTWHDLGFIGDANVNSWADTVRSIQRKYSQINTVVPGHGEIGDSAILAHTIIQAEKKGL